jgi:hypothetical protein
MVLVKKWYFLPDCLSAEALAKAEGSRCFQRADNQQKVILVGFSSWGGAVQLGGI